MPNLPGTTKECFRALKTAIVEQVKTLDLAGKVWERVRFAANINQWVDLAAVEIGGNQYLRVVFVALADFRTERKENRKNSITAVFEIEVIQGFDDGTDEANSTLAFEDCLGDLNDLFRDEESLGFTSFDSNPVLNLPLTGVPTEGGSTPQEVDGLLAHRKKLSLEVTFRIC